MTVSLTPHGLRVGEEDLPLISGTMHYWRVPRAKWGECLDRVAEMGFRIVETYVPWSVHEIERGRFDFGERDADKDFPAFAGLVHEKGLKLLVRPGPHINAEITYFGYPKRLFAIEDALARGPEGAAVILPVFPRMFPVPSYASERFYEEARLWFDAVGPRIAELLWPKGPIVGVQADNELSFFFRTSLFDQDYSEAALSLYRKFAREAYGELGEANRVWGTDYAGWDTVAPPRRFEPKGAPRLPYYLDWAAFKESLIRHGLRRCAELLAAAGVSGVPIYHNHPPAGTGSPFDIATAEQELAAVGFDLYPTRREYASVRRVARHLAGASRLPYIPEFSSGCFPWWTPITAADQRFTTWVPFMHGVRAIDFYMIVERERWYGSPVTAEGRVRPEYFELFQTFHRVLEASDLLRKDKETPALVLEDLDYDRLELAASLVDPLPPILLEVTGVPEARRVHPDALGFGRPIQMENSRVRLLAETSLEAARIPFDLAYTSLPLERLARYRLVVLPTFEFLARGVQEKLVAYARAGGTLAIGPRVPERDRTGDPCDILRYALGDVVEGIGGGEHRARAHRVGEGRIVVVTHPDQSFAPGAPLWEKLGVTPPIRWEGEGIDATLFRGKGPRIVMVANPTAEARATSLSVPGARGALDLVARAEADLASLKLEPYSVRVLEVRE